MICSYLYGNEPTSWNIDMQHCAILLLAAGASSRMRGRDKLLEPVNGVPLLQVMVRRSAETGMPVFVTQPDPKHPRCPYTVPATPVYVPGWQEGMAASIRAGVKALPPDVEAVMILPADMPDITEQDLLKVAGSLHGHDPAIVRACTETGKPGHPVLFPRRYFSELMQVKGHSGGREILRHRPVRKVLLPGEHAAADLDTPEDWQNWRARTGTVR